MPARAWLTFWLALLRAAVECGFALGVPLLDALLANLVSFGARQAKLFSIFSGPRFRCGNGLLRLFHRAFGQARRRASVAVSGLCTRNS